MHNKHNCNGFIAMDTYDVRRENTTGVKMMMVVDAL